MIKFVKGDIFQTSCECLVNPVNTNGKMGQGLAKEFKKRFPKMFVSYEMACDDGSLDIGKCTFHNTLEKIDGKRKTIVNFPTKKDWWDKSKYEYIEQGLISLKERLYINCTQSVAIPPLGCGLGGLKWEKVREMIKLSFETDDRFKDIIVEIYDQ